MIEDFVVMDLHAVIATFEEFYAKIISLASVRMDRAVNLCILDLNFRQHLISQKIQRNDHQYVIIAVN
jgi:hypothetical protein